MDNQIESKIIGSFYGFNGDAIFKLVNGQVWQQAVYRYEYHYAYRPDVRIYEGSNGDVMMEVEGMKEPIQVRKASIEVEGIIESDFSGYEQGMTFEFNNGQVWEQTENKYRYKYLSRPKGIVVKHSSDFQLHIEGMDGIVKVRRTT